MREKSAHFFIIELGTFFDYARTTYCDKNIPIRYVKKRSVWVCASHTHTHTHTLSHTHSLFFFLFARIVPNNFIPGLRERERERETTYIHYFLRVSRRDF